jgi:hypothetical protein
VLSDHHKPYARQGSLFVGDLPRVVRALQACPSSVAPLVWVAVVMAPGAWPHRRGAAQTRFAHDRGSHAHRSSSVPDPQRTYRVRRSDKRQQVSLAVWRYWPSGPMKPVPLLTFSRTTTNARRAKPRLASRTYNVCRSCIPRAITNTRMGEALFGGKDLQLTHRSQPPESDRGPSPGRSPVWRADPRCSYERSVASRTPRVAARLGWSFLITP